MPPDATPDTPLHLSVTEGRVVSRLNGESTVVKLEPGSRRLDAGPGEVCLIPRGVPHALANLGDVPVSWLTLLSPGERSGWIDEEERLLDQAHGDPSLVDDAALHAVHERYGLEIVGPPPAWSRGEPQR